MLEGKSRPVYFIPEDSVFADTDLLSPAIHYPDLLNLRGNVVNTVELKKGQTSIAIIHQPTFFNLYDQFLVYPGEHIIIKKGKYNDFTFEKMHGSKRRNRELSFFKVISELRSNPPIPRIREASIDTILRIEKERKSNFEYVVQLHRLFDSLSAVFGVSKKFKNIAEEQYKNRLVNNSYGFYRAFADTLQIHGLYKEKLKQLLPLYNAINEKSSFEGVVVSFNEIANKVLPYPIWKITKADDFQSSFDSVLTNFSSLAKDYLLSQLMYRAYTRRIPIPLEYTKKYESTCADKSFRKLIDKIKYQQEKNDDMAVGSNRVLSIDGGEMESFENILSKNKGKLILIDFWATWCAPCREDMPFMKKLMQQYSEDKLVLLKVSVEKEIQPWQKYIIANSERTNQYLMIDQANSSFLKQYNINTIPRYMLIDKEGRVINAEAPPPGDPKLKELLDKLVAER